SQRYGPRAILGAPGTTMMRVFHWRPSVEMHHQRSAWQSSVTTTRNVFRVGAFDVADDATVAQLDGPLAVGRRGGVVRHDHDRHPVLAREPAQAIEHERAVPRIALR